MATDVVLQATGLHLRVGARTLLDDVAMTVRKGEVVAVVGPSGSGKTTLLRALGGVAPMHAGVVTVHGQSLVYPDAIEQLARGDVPWLWPTVTMVFQQLFLWPHLTLRENIELPLRVHGRLDAVAATDAANFVKRLGLAESIDRYPNEVSGGQRQRAALVRALVLQPKVLLLDEITSALDVLQVQAVVEVLTERARQGMAVVMVTHLLNFARQMADQVVFMDAGRVVEFGRAEILTKPQTRSLQAFVAAAKVAS